MSEHRDTADAIRVLIADDSPLFRRGISVVLATEEEIAVIAEAENGEEAITKAAEYAPDVVLMDVRMPRVNGIEAARAIRESSPSTKIIMLTVSDEDDDLYEAIKAGANSYLLKEVSVEEVPGGDPGGRAGPEPDLAVDGVQAAQRVHEPGPPGRGEAAVPDAGADPAGAGGAQLVAKGQSNREIGDELFISENTVKNHVRNILEKLHLHSQDGGGDLRRRERLLNIHDDVDRLRQSATGRAPPGDDDGSRGGGGLDRRRWTHRASGSHRRPLVGPAPVPRPGPGVIVLDATPAVDVDGRGPVVDGRPDLSRCRRDCRRLRTPGRKRTGRSRTTFEDDHPVAPFFGTPVGASAAMIALYVWCSGG